MDSKSKRSKGNFFNLLDWRRNSKKKVHEAREPKLEVAVSHSQGDERRASSISSVTNDEECCPLRPPSVVAKLMGLDSMPSFGPEGSSSSRSFDSRSLRSFRCDGSQYSAAVYSHVHSMREGYFLDSMQPRHYMVQSRPTGRYQTENFVLNSVGNHVLLPRNTAAQVTQTASRFPPVASSSVPGRIRDLNDKKSGRLAKWNDVKNPRLPSVSVPEQRRGGLRSRSVDELKRKEHGGTKARRSPPPERKKSLDIKKQNGQTQNGVVGKAQPIAKTPVNNTPRKPDLRGRKVLVVSGGERMSDAYHKKRAENSHMNFDVRRSGIVSISKDEKDFQYRYDVENVMDVHPRSLVNSMDVVSFTFSSPMKTKSGSKYFRSEQAAIGSALDEKVISSDSLFVQQDSCWSASSQSNLPSVLKPAMVYQLLPGAITFDCLGKSEFSSPSKSYTSPCQNDKRHESGEVEHHDHSSEGGKLIEYQKPSPVSILEPLFDGGRRAHKSNKKLFMEPEESDASTDSTGIFISLKGDASFASEADSSWETTFLRSILQNARFKLDEFVAGEAPAAVELAPFHGAGNEEDDAGLSERRQLLFDCTSELLQAMSGHVSLKELTRLQALFEADGLIAERIGKEISNCKGMRDLMVDEVIYTDMSSRHGKWLDFRVEAWEEGVNMVSEILTSLVEELVSDLERNRSCLVCL